METYTDSNSAAAEHADTGSDRRELLRVAGTRVAVLGLLSTTGGALTATRKSTPLPSGANNFHASDKVTLIPFDKLTSFFKQHLVAASA